MFAQSVSPEELCITNELIIKSIEENCGKEWRSQQEFLDYLEERKNEIDWCVIGWITTKTMKKWNILLEIKINEMRNEEIQKYWILTRGKGYWLVSKFVF